jgi:ectoine hydroxylase-related dioxygenase (phytanoyl-CoA dioxygenase family)
MPLGLQGILYLTDTAAEQGAFTCVPGFHHRLEQWLADLPPGAEPRQLDRDLLDAAIPIAGRAGDLVIWHHALPHGSRPNRTARPRLVQYISMFPTTQRDDRPWR